MGRLRVLDLFAGTRSISKAFEELGHETISIEYDEKHPNITLYADILSLSAEDIRSRFGEFDVIWASPPCESFSVASIGRHWIKGTNLPKSENAEYGLKLLQHTVELIKELKPKYFFIENPRGKMRKMDCMEELPRYTVTYCQYGDFRMKPTDIWTNHPDTKFKAICKNGDPCHVAAPRGSQTGTQGKMSYSEKSKIPHDLCLHVARISEE